MADSVKYAEEKIAGGNAVVIDAGLCIEDGRQAFCRPGNCEHDSWSLANLQETAEGDKSTFRTVGIAVGLLDIDCVSQAAA